MDINDARVATTVLSLILFIGIMFWTWSKQRLGGFEQAAQLPFIDSVAPIESAGEKQ